MLYIANEKISAFNRAEKPPADGTQEWAPTSKDELEGS